MTTTTLDRQPRINWLGSTPFFLIHVGALVLPFLVPFHWRDLLLVVGLYYFRMFFIATGFHRYFSHRSYRTSRAYQFVIALFGGMCAQKGAMWWASHHRAHHLYSDTDLDVHSPARRGFWWSHVLWIVDYRYELTDTKRIRDFARYPEIVWLNKHHYAPVVLLAAILYAVGGAEWLVWGFFVSTVLLWHGTFTINSLAHVFGSRRYATTDTSRNNFLLALITNGEGWHNNHHHYQSSANQGFYWWEIDLGYYVLRLLEAVGVIWDVRRPPPRVYEEALAGKRDRAPAALPVLQPSRRAM
jgi:stearoyl-CoA desaturase (delta-9 desaturase)